jgi:hypothetical protein
MSAIPGTLSYEDLNILYEENKSKLYMSEKDGVGQHILDAQGFAKWIGHLTALHNISEDGTEVPTYLAFAEALQANIRYVTFPEYMAKIQQLASEILGLIEKCDTVFFVVSGKNNKSNMWIMLLYFGELLKMNIVAFKDKIYGISLKSHDHGDKASELMCTYAKRNPTKNVSAFHFDDMSYSGQQVEQSIADILRFIYNKQIANLNYYITVGYITRHAKRLFSQMPIKMLANTEQVPDIGQIMKSHFKDKPTLLKSIRQMCTSFGNFTIMLARNNPPSYALKRGRNAFDCRLDKAAIYFDHKIADDLSVLSTLFSKGSYPKDLTADYVKAGLKKFTTNTPLFSGSLISACNGSPDECYGSFYKKFYYTFLSKTLQPNEYLMDEIVRIKSAKGGKRKTLRLKKSTY